MAYVLTRRCCVGERRRGKGVSSTSEAERRPLEHSNGHVDVANGCPSDTYPVSLKFSNSGNCLLSGRVRDECVALDLFTCVYRGSIQSMGNARVLSLTKDPRP